MIRLRPIEKKDTERFIQLAMLGSVGVTSLPKNKDLLEEKIQHSLEIFSSCENFLVSKSYLFIAENLETGEITGTSGILALSGGDSSTHLYRIQEELRADGQKMPILVPIHHKKGPSELCGLFLNRTHRQAGHGKLLSIGRFLFIAQFRERFTSHLAAMMRGHFEEGPHSPFWDAIGRKFYDVSLEKILHEVSLDKRLTAKILPSFPIYIHLLPHQAQEDIQAVHDHTLPALNFLIEEGFKMIPEIDIIDAGPRIEAEIKKIRTIRNSKKTHYKIGEVINGRNALISNCRLNFRAVHAHLQEDEDGIMIDSQVADALELEEGEEIFYCITK